MLLSNAGIRASNSAHQKLHVLACHARWARKRRHRASCHQRCIGGCRCCAAAGVGDNLRWAAGKQCMQG